MKNRCVPSVYGPLLLAVAIFLAVPQAHAMTMTGVLKDNSNTNMKKFTKEEEKNYIRESGIKADFSVQVTTKNQKKFDRNRDGYLSGRELEEYLRKYD